MNATYRVDVGPQRDYIDDETIGRLYHFVHLAKYFIIIQWSGRHSGRKMYRRARLREKRFGLKEMMRLQTAARRSASPCVGLIWHHLMFCLQHIANLHEVF